MSGTGPSDEEAVAEPAADAADRPGTDGSDAPVRLEPTEVLSRVARRRRAQRPVAGRTAAIVTAAVVLLGVAAVSALAPPPAATPAPPAGDGVTVPPADAHASSFFCVTGAGADAGSGAATTVSLVNSTGSAAVGIESAVGTSGGSPVRTRVVVPARGALTVNPAAGIPSGATASSFAFARGGVTGTAVVSGPQGWSVAPCMTQVSSQWDFAGGSTASGLLDLSLYNPTAASAVVDVTFLTTDGTVLDPQSYEGIALGAGQVVDETLGSYVQNQGIVSTLVEATSGAVVATELDQMAVPAGSGLALLNGTPGPASTWRFAQTTAVAGGSVTLAVANPGGSTVTADVTAGLPGATVVPHQLTVPPRTVTTYVVSSVAGWPLGSPYSLTVSATGPVVVGRTVIAPPGGTPPQAGIAPGTTTTASSWLVAGPGAPGLPSAPGGAIASLAVANPGPSSVEVSVRALGGGRPLATANVPADSVAVFGSAQVGGLRPLVVTASGPVTVEAEGTPTAAPGVVSWSGFALVG
jgi:hypothetical protein